MKECVTEGTKLVQAIADTLFNLPSTETNDGPLVQLPPPTTKLPREKHVRIADPLFVLFTISSLMRLYMHDRCWYVIGFIKFAK